MKIERFGLDKSAVAQRETIFHTANGYLGVRASFEEGVPAKVRSIRGAYINAFYDSSPILYGEKLYGFASTSQTIVNIVDVQGIRLILDGERFDPFRGELKSFEQILDMDTGLYTRRLVWRSPHNKTSQIEFVRMTSFSRCELFTIQVTVKPLDWSGILEVISTQDGDVTNDWDPTDPRKAFRKRHMLLVDETFFDGDTAFIQCRTSRSNLFLTSAVRHTISNGFTVEKETTRTRNTIFFKGAASPDTPAELIKWCVFTDSRRHTSTLADAKLLITQLSAKPIQVWYRAQKMILTDFWRASRITIKGDDKLDTSIVFSVYSLFQAAGRDSVSAIPSKGLSGEGYEGHYFWDTEIYMFPLFLLTNRAIAKSLLDFRFTTLPKAREQARLLGHTRGALYPWRTINGEECSAYFPSGSAQYHINGDIAHAFITYYFVTGDLAYMAQKGAEVLVETARLWLDTGHWLDGSFRIDCVTGPDEYTSIVNNNYYTNMAAKHHLRWTARIVRRIWADSRFDGALDHLSVTEEELLEFEKVSEGMFLPFDKQLGICAQDDSFLDKKSIPLAAFPKDSFPLLLHYHPLSLYRLQVCKQADTVLAHFLFEEDVPDKVIAATYAYYENVTTHDSSLSPCVFSMMAARIGKTEKAMDYYLRTARMDLDDTYGNTSDGIHAANMGGSYMGIVFGFAGLRIHDDGLLLRPCIPQGIRSYRFRLMYRQTLFEVTVTRDRLLIRNVNHVPEKISVYGNETLIETSRTFPLQDVDSV